MTNVGYDAEKQARLEEQRKRRNERRNAKYREDAEVRRQIQERNRKAYQKNTGVELEDCRDNIPRLSEFGTTRRLVSSGQQALTFTNAELAEAMGHDRQALYRWQGRHQIPVPATPAMVWTGGFGREDREEVHDVYTLPEVEAILTHYGKHKQQNSHFRQSHKDTIRNIHSAVMAAR